MRIAATAIRAGARRASRSFASTSQLLSVTAQIRLSSSSSTYARPPLLQLDKASLKTLLSSSPLTWTINDAGADECWAIIAPASEAGGLLRRELIDVLSGRLRPRKSTTNLQHEPPHPFLLDPSNPGQHLRSTGDAIKHVSFATKMGSSSSSGEFTNYSARYGAIRDQDRVTLYERLMDLLDCPTGLIAQTKLVPDPFSNDQDQTGLFKYKSDHEKQTALEKAKKADRVIRDIAPLLMINDDLLHRPVIALSNGQTRRARILSSLITGAELVVLEEPFSGIDVGTRQRLNTLFADLHAGRRPRLVLVLREQDAVPDLVTHVLRVNDEGDITAIGARNASPSASASSEPLTGSALIQSNAAAHIGQSDTSSRPVIALKDVSIIYGTKTVLDKVSLCLHPGTRLILAGDNGSGKTTLLALLLGDHPKSFSFPSSSLSLFSHARDHPSNARTLLNRRMGHLSPELFNAFPRKPVATGGLTVGEVVASGFQNVFARRAYTEPQKERVWQLLSLFSDLIKSPQSSSSSSSSLDIKQLSSLGFASLSHGSQAIVLFLRAVVGNPCLLVLDEPFQGMDKRQVERTREFVDCPEKFPLGGTEEEVDRDLEERKRMAIVCVSHYESEWPQTFGSLLRLRDGQVVERISI